MPAVLVAVALVVSGDCAAGSEDLADEHLKRWFYPHFGKQWAVTQAASKSGLTAVGMLCDRNPFS